MQIVTLFVDHPASGTIAIVAFMIAALYAAESRRHFCVGSVASAACAELLANAGPGVLVLVKTWPWFVVPFFVVGAVHGLAIIWNEVWRSTAVLVR